MKRTLLLALTLLFCVAFASAGDRSFGEIKPLRPLAPPPNVIVPTPFCGNGVAEDGEECDPGQPDYGLDPDLGRATCEGQGFNGGGEIACTSKCTLDISACHCNVGTTFPATGQTRCIDEGLNEIDCAGTGRDGEIRAGAMLAYTDNDDGTITDDNTGLMWEKKNFEPGSIHVVTRGYEWEATFTDFITTLNNTCEGDGLVACDSDDNCGTGGQCGFAGYRDWRMPNVKELQSIVYYEWPQQGHGWPGAAHPAFNIDCVLGCTDCSCSTFTYWSSTAAGSMPFYVDFTLGRVDVYFPSLAYGARAVRGGLD